MTLVKVRDWLEIVGLFSVVLSLVFVGFQIKQSQDIALAAQYQARADHNLQLAAIQFENDEYMQAVGSSAEIVWPPLSTNMVLTEASQLTKSRVRPTTF